jgi:hypothetical protein
MVKAVPSLRALLLSVGSGAAVAVGQVWLAGRAGVLDWRACFCDAGGDESYRFIAVFLAWFQAMAVVAGAVLGWLTVRRSGTSLALLVALVATAAAGSFAAVPVVTAAHATATFADSALVLGAAVAGVALGMVGALLAVKFPRAAASAGLCWLWLWAVGLMATRDDGGYTPALGTFYGGSGRFYGHAAHSGTVALATAETFAPAAGLALIVAGVAWWGTGGMYRRSGAMLAALLGPALMFVAYLIVRPGNENAGPWDVAGSTTVLAVMAAAVGSVVGAWRDTRRRRIPDVLVVLAALGGAANEVFADLFPVSGHYRGPGAGLSLSTLLLLPALVFAADAAARDGTGVAKTG